MIYINPKNEMRAICEFDQEKEPLSGPTISKSKGQYRLINYVLSPIQRLRKHLGNRDIWECAIAEPGTETAEVLIKAGEDINKSRYSTPTVIAVEHNRVDILETLLKAGADPASPLRIAAVKNMFDVVKVLFKYGAGKNKRECSNALAEFFPTGSVEMLELLLSLGIYVDENRAIEAVTNNNRDKHKKLQLLIAHGLDVKKKYTRIDPWLIKQLGSGTYTVQPSKNPSVESMTLAEWAAKVHNAEPFFMLMKAGSTYEESSWWYMPSFANGTIFGRKDVGGLLVLLLVTIVPAITVMFRRFYPERLWVLAVLCSLNGAIAQFYLPGGTIFFIVIAGLDVVLLKLSRDGRIITLLNLLALLILYLRYVRMRWKREKEFLPPDAAAADQKEQL